MQSNCVRLTSDKLSKEGMGDHMWNMVWIADGAHEAVMGISRLSGCQSYEKESSFIEGSTPSAHSFFTQHRTTSST